MASTTPSSFAESGTNDPGASTSTPATGNPPSGTDTSTLYLVTFLATILVLVLLSGSLLARSYILRRRYRARLQQAIADGLFVDLDRTAFAGPGLFTPIPFAGPSHRSTRRFGTKPVLWETYVQPSPGKEHSKPHFWSSVTPITIRFTSPPPTSDSSSMSPDSPSSPHQRPSIFSYLRLPRRISSFSSRSQSSRTPPQSQSPIGPSQTNLIGTGTRSPPQPQDASASAVASPNLGPRTDTDADTDAGSISVCVLISMPDAHAPHSSLSRVDKGKAVDTSDYSPSHQHAEGDDTHASHTRPADKDTFPIVEFGVIEMKATGLGELSRATSEGGGQRVSGK